MEVLLKPGDIFFTRGPGLFSRAIRFFTRSIGEKRTKVNHVGVIVEEGGIQTAVVVEALIKVRKHRLWKQYGSSKGQQVAVYRAKNLNPEHIEIIVTEANRQIGKLYGFGKIIAHLLDRLLSEIYLFRRLTNSPRYPICSWLVARSYSKAGKYFGVAPGAANPDDIWDFVNRRTDVYEPIIELGSLARFAPSPEDSIPSHK